VSNVHEMVAVRIGKLGFRIIPLARMEIRAVFRALTFRGQTCIGYQGPDGPEVLYRHSNQSHALAILSALERAYWRGVEEALKGWPQSEPGRPLFELVGPVLMERHSKMGGWGDRTMFTVTSEADGRMALDAVQRAATLGAMSVGAQATGAPVIRQWHQAQAA
jgi:hypothetical protein